jgi:hypothetical protein
MTHLDLPQFQTPLKNAVGLMTLADAEYLVSQGWLTPEGVVYLFPHVVRRFIEQSSIEQSSQN